MLLKKEAQVSVLFTVCLFVFFFFLCDGPRFDADPRKKNSFHLTHFCLKKNNKTHQQPAFFSFRRIFYFFEGGICFQVFAWSCETISGVYLTLKLIYIYKQVPIQISVNTFIQDTPQPGVFTGTETGVCFELKHEKQLWTSVPLGDLYKAVYGDLQKICIRSPEGTAGIEGDYKWNKMEIRPLLLLAL